VVGDERSVVEDSFSRGLLDCPHYTRPAELREGAFDGAETRVPDVLLSGNHAEIRRWRKREAVSRTLDRRPDLLEHAVLDDEERAILKALVTERGKS
jgi:tRNA (guanine37-N1)-methyltransferase